VAVSGDASIVRMRTLVRRRFWRRVKTVYGAGGFGGRSAASGDPSSASDNDVANVGNLFDSARAFSVGGERGSSASHVSAMLGA